MPPDPAVEQGRHHPGERIEVEKDARWWEASRWTNKLGKDKGKGKEKSEREDNQAEFQEKDTNAAVRSPNSETVEEDAVLASKAPSRIPQFKRLSTIMSMNSDGSQSKVGRSRGFLNPSNSYDNRTQAEQQRNTANPYVSDGAGTTEENGSGRSDAGYGPTEESYARNSERPLHRYPPSV